MGCDVVLGVWWLQILGTISGNFKKLTMQFNHHEQDVVLQEIMSTQLLEERSCSEISKLEKKKKVILQLINEPESLASVQEHPKIVHKLLDQFNDVFLESKGLPPCRE